MASSSSGAFEPGISRKVVTRSARFTAKSPILSRSFVIFSAATINRISSSLNAPRRSNRIARVRMFHGVLVRGREVTALRDTALREDHKEIAYRHVVGIVGLLTQAPHRETGKARAILKDDVFEMLDRDRLCLCHAVNIHELGKDEFYLVGLEEGFGSFSCHPWVLG